MGKVDEASFACQPCGYVDNLCDERHLLLNTFSLRFKQPTLYKHLIKRDWTTSSNYVNYSILNFEHNRNIIQLLTIVPF